MKQLLDHILLEQDRDIFKPITKEEIPIRRRGYLKSLFDELGDKVVHNNDGTVDINGDLVLNSMELTSLLDLPYKIRKVTGYFTCYNNELTTLEGEPESVGGDFDCWNNKLTTLRGAPKQVGGDFSCHYNKLPEDVKVPSKVKGRIVR